MKNVILENVEADRILKFLDEVGNISLSQVAQKPIAQVPDPADRKDGWTKFGDLMVTIPDDQEKGFQVGTGYLETAGDQMIVWLDGKHSGFEDGAQDLQRKFFYLTDPRLMRMDELDVFNDPERAAQWFRVICTPDECQHIIKLIHEFRKSLKEKEGV